MPVRGLRCYTNTTPDFAFLEAIRRRDGLRKRFHAVALALDEQLGLCRWHRTLQGHLILHRHTSATVFLDAINPLRQPLHQQCSRMYGGYEHELHWRAWWYLRQCSLDYVHKGQLRGVDRQ